MKYIYTKLTALFFLALFTLTNTNINAQVYNDGQIRLRVWVHKVWSNANCDEAGLQEYVAKNIQVRVPNSTTPTYDVSQSGFNLRWDGDNNTFYSMTQLAGTQLPSSIILESPATKGYKLFDKTYTGTIAPNRFEFRVAEFFDDDCGNVWNYESSCGFLGLETDDDRVTMSSFQNVYDFRSAPEGEVHYALQEVTGGSRSDFYGVVLAYQWDWVTPLPDLCASPVYDDAPVDLDVEFMGVWSDSDFDGGACLVSVSGLEDIRVKFRAKDNLDLNYSAWECVNCDFGLPLTVLNQQFPEWNLVPTGSVPMLSRSYAAGTTDMESFTFEFEVWEGEDGNGTCADALECQYNSTGVNADDFQAFITKTISWRDAPADVWNEIDVPVRISSAVQFGNWIVKLRYKYTMATPTVSISGSTDLVECVGTSTTISPDVTNGTYYQWQVADDNSVGGPACPVGATWTDIPGETCRNFTPPQTIGSKVYRLVVSNRDGAGSTSASGPRLAIVNSECIRVTYFESGSPAPAINSPLCGLAISDGASGTFSIPTPPNPDGFANVTSYTWSVSPSLPGINITNPNNPTTDITFNTGGNGGTYTVVMTVNTPCGDMTSSCNVIISSGACGYIHVSPSGNNAFPGTSLEPVNTLQQALVIASGDPSRNHIRLLEGSYNINTPISIPNNIIIEGGWEIASGNWRKNTSAISEINFSAEEIINTEVAHVIGFKSNGTSGWLLQDLTINTANAVGQTSAGFGKSNYAVWLNNASNYDIVRCVVNTGSATNGLGDPNTGGFNSAWDGRNGNNGAVGVTGGAGECSCAFGTDDGGTGGNGGAGGSGGSNATLIGGAAQSGFSGGRGGNGRDDNTSASGFPGLSGSGSSAGSGGGGGPQDGNNGDTPYGGFGNNAGSGSSGINGVTVASSFLSGFYSPSFGTDGTPGTAGSGGGGGGGAARDTGGCDAAGGGGSGGSGGGGAGGAGAGAKGGGSSYGIFVFNGGANGQILNSEVNSGNFGAGGAGGSGGSGGAGATQSALGNGCSDGDANRGGRGGSGGSGGDGGDGGDADNGERIAIASVGGGTAPTVNSLSPIVVNSSATGGFVPVTPVNTARYERGCTNSEVYFTKSSGAFSSFGVDGQLVDNISVGNFFYPTNEATVYYTSTGVKDLENGSTIYNNFVFIDDVRDLPEIFVAEDTICNGDSLNITSNPNSLNGAKGFTWSIQQISNPYSPANPGPSVYNGTVEDPGNVTVNYFGGPGALGYGVFQIKYQVNDECCGMSIPVYETVFIAADPSSAPIVQGGGDYCFGSTGLPISVLGSENGVTYELYLNGVTTGQTLLGTGGTISFGNQLLAGLYEVYAYREVGCEILLNTNVTINIVPTPTRFNVTGGGTVCTSSTTGVDIGIDGSEIGTQYTLYYDDLGTWTPVASTNGSGGAVSFGPQTDLGDYYVIAQYLSPPGCIDTMQGSVSITSSAGPNVYNVIGGGSYCIGSGGAEILLDSSELDVTYQLYYNASVSVGLPINGTGDTISFNNQTLEGFYYVIATDSNGCTANMNNLLEVTQLKSPVFDSLFVEEPNCNGASDGTIDVYGTSFNGGLNYVVNDDTSTANLFSGLADGNYFISIYDDSLCATNYPVRPIQLDEPSELNVALESISDVNCFGRNQGLIGINVTGGTPAYSYTWTSSNATFSSSDEDISGLAGGDYYLSVSDAKGCSVLDTFTITSPSVALSATLQLTDVLCFDSLSGSASVVITGGTAPYTYLWQNNDTAQSISNLGVGSVSVTVTDANGCSTYVSGTISGPSSPLNITLIRQRNVTCFGGSDGELITSISGGTAPYTILWTPSGDTTATVTGLSANSHTITVTDSNGCSESATYTITQPTELVSNISPTQPDCPGRETGIASVGVNGGTLPYSYEWNTTPAQFGIVATQLSGDKWYTVTITDNNNCVLVDSVFLQNPDTIEVSVAPGNSNCISGRDGFASIIVDGGFAPYSYELNGNFQTDSFYNNLSPGNYFVSVEDNKGCEASTQFTISSNTSVQVNLFGSTASVVNEDEEILIVNGEQVDFDAILSNTNDSTQIVNYIWSPVNFDFTDCVEDTLCPNPSANITNTTQIVVEVIELINGVGCSTFDTLDVSVRTDFPVFFPTAFTPNNDDCLNDYFEMNVAGAKNLDVKVYNRWGELVFANPNQTNGPADPNALDCSNPRNAWDGTFNGKLVPMGSYVYQVVVTYFDEREETFSGTVTVLR